MSKKPEKQTAKPTGRKPAKAGSAAVAKSAKSAAQAARTKPASGRRSGAVATAKRAPEAAAKRAPRTARAKASGTIPGKAAASARKAAPRKPASRPGAPARDQAKAKATRKTAVTAVAQSSAKKKTPTVRFSDADLKEFHDQLMKLRNDLVGKVTFLRDSSLQREDEVNHAEDGSDAFDRLFSLERADGVQSRIYAIDEALREIADGTYGICQNCESLIRKQRLLALPFARNCIECQAAQERKRNGQGAPAAPRRLIP